MTLEQFGAAVAAAKYWVLGCVVVLLAVVLGLGATAPEQYGSEVTFSVQPPSGDDDFTISASFLQFVVPAVAERADSDSLRDSVAAAVLGTEESTVPFAVETSVTPNSGLVKLHVSSPRRDVVLPLLSQYTDALEAYPQQASLPIQVRLLQPALAPDVEPRTQGLVVAALQAVVLGLVIGVLLALALQRRRQGRRDLAQAITERFDVPAVVAPAADVELVEADQLLAVAAQVRAHRRGGRHGHVVVLPLSEDAAGTAVGAGLGRALATLGDRVVLAELDQEARRRGLVAASLRLVDTTAGRNGDGLRTTAVEDLHYASPEDVLRLGSERRPGRGPAAVAAALPRLAEAAEHRGAVLVLDAPHDGAGPHVDAVLTWAEDVVLVVRASALRRGVDGLARPLAKVLELSQRCAAVVVLVGPLVESGREEAPLQAPVTASS